MKKVILLVGLLLVLAGFAMYKFYFANNRVTNLQYRLRGYDMRFELREEDSFQDWPVRYTVMIRRDGKEHSVGFDTETPVLLIAANGTGDSLLLVGTTSGFIFYSAGTGFEEKEGGRLSTEKDRDSIRLPGFRPVLNISVRKTFTIPDSTLGVEELLPWNSEEIK